MKVYHSILFVLSSLSIYQLKSLIPQRVILATNEKNLYIQFWPITSLMWNKIVGVTPTLALIAHNKKKLEKGVGEVVRFKPLPGIPTSFQAQVIRLLLPALYPDDVCIISDIDMIPLQKKYFIDSIQKYPNSVFIVYRDKAYGPDAKQYPMCYLAAQGKIFAEIFNVHNKKDIKRTIKEWYDQGLGWMTDELMLYKYLHNWPCFSSHCIRLGEGVGPRIDRADWQYDSKKLKENYYIDSHMLRPYKKYKKQIDALIKTRLQK